MSKQLVVSQKEIYRDSLYQVWSSKNKSKFEDSKAYGIEVSKFVYEWDANRGCENGN